MIHHATSNASRLCLVICAVLTALLLGCGDAPPPSEPDTADSRTPVGPITLAWDDFREVAIETSGDEPIDLVLPEHLQEEIAVTKVTLPPQIMEAVGKRVRLTEGIGVLNQSGVVDGQVRCFALLPEYAVECGCCDAPHPDFRWTIFVDCAEKPWPEPEDDPVRADVEGILELRKKNYLNCVFALTDVTVTTRPILRK